MSASFASAFTGAGALSASSAPGRRLVGDSDSAGPGMGAGLPMNAVCSARCAG